MQSTETAVTRYVQEETKHVAGTTTARTSTSTVTMMNSFLHALILFQGLTHLKQGNSKTDDKLAMNVMYVDPNNPTTKLKLGAGITRSVNAVTRPQQSVVSVRSRASMAKLHGYPDDRQLMRLFKRIMDREH